MTRTYNYFIFSMAKIESYSKNNFSITGVSNNAVIAEDFNKLIDEISTLHFQIKNLKEIQKWKNWRFR